MHTNVQRLFRARIVLRTLIFKQPAGTSRGVYHERKVWYILLISTTGDGAKGVGECAPLPSLSADDLDDRLYVSTLRGFLDVFEQTGIIDYEAMRPFPSMLFGLETALSSYRLSLKKPTLCFFDNAFANGHTYIPINGLIWMGNYDEMQQRIEQKLENGSCCIKLKIGAICFEQELQLLKKVRERFGADMVQLRVDANGAFTIHDALNKMEQLSQYHIHSIEQPIRAGQYDAMAHLCRNTPLPIALDEELIGVHQLADKRQLLHKLQPQYIVLKPSLHGGLSGAEEWMTVAKEKHIAYWVTSALETNVGLRAIAEWCYQTIYNHPATEAKCKQLHQGLGTGLLYVDNVEAAALHLEGERLWSKSKAQRDYEAAFEELKIKWNDASSEMQVNSSGSTGRPKVLVATKEQYKNSAFRTCRALGLQPDDSALICLPLQYIAGCMMAVRTFVWGVNPILVAPTSRPFTNLQHAPHFAALTPMQVFETLKHPHEARLLKQVKQLLIGGGHIPHALEKQLKTFPHAVWSTYGMAETLSNIALRRLNGHDATSAYIPLNGVMLSVDSDQRLIINDQVLGIRNLLTNDLARMHSNGHFSIIGRADNVICSGGLKWLPEDIEENLSALPFPFQITSILNDKLGHAVAIIYTSHHTPQQVQQLCRTLIQGPSCPKHCFKVDTLPVTPTGKPARAVARAIAQQLSESVTPHE